MFKIKYLRNSIVLLAVLPAALSALAQTSQQTWKPSKTVELVVGSAPGGSPDVMARVVQNIFQSTGLVPSSTVVNKPGAANTIGWAYLNQHSGDAHYIATISPALTPSLRSPQAISTTAWRYSIHVQVWYCVGLVPAMGWCSATAFPNLCAARSSTEKTVV